MEEELRICLINESFPPQVDGVANAVENYAAIINEKYGKAVVAVPFYPGADDGRFPFRVLRFPSINTEKLINYRMGYPFSAEILEEIKAEKVDLIHAHCPFVSAFMARTLREKLDVPIILTYHSKFDIDIKKAVKSEYLRKKILHILAENIKAFDEVWVVSRGAGENLRSIGYEGDYILMPNGADMPKGRMDKKEAGERTAAFKVPEGIPVFLFVGRLAWYKGIDKIFSALSVLKEKGKDFRMVLIGGGTDEKEIKEKARVLKIEASCIFTGIIREREDLRAWYSRADIFVFPSGYDTNGLVVREAAACALPSVLIKGSCAAEDITEGKNGFLCEDSAESLAEKLLFLMEKPELLRKAGESAREEIFLSWEDSVRKAAERYHTVLKKYKAGEYERKHTPMDEWFGAKSRFLEKEMFFKKEKQKIFGKAKLCGKKIKKSAFEKLKKLR